MASKTITLTTREDLKVFMSPLRQELLRILEINGRPMTAKALADKLNISASSVQHHIKKLAGLGLVAPDHTEMINGITASFFRLEDVTVSIGGQITDDLTNERSAVIKNVVGRKLEAYLKGFEAAKAKGISMDNLSRYGDVRTGVLHLSPSDAKELFGIISDYIAGHAKAGEGKAAYEFALVLYNAEALENEILK
jgi:DNA-binding transcriptional ArsR family regulator